MGIPLDVSSDCSAEDTADDSAALLPPLSAGDVAGCPSPLPSDVVSDRFADVAGEGLIAQAARRSRNSAANRKQKAKHFFIVRSLPFGLFN